MSVVSVVPPSPLQKLEALPHHRACCCCCFSRKKRCSILGLLCILLVGAEFTKPLNAALVDVAQLAVYNASTMATAAAAGGGGGDVAEQQPFEVYQFSMDGSSVDGVPSTALTATTTATTDVVSFFTLVLLLTTIYKFKQFLFLPPSLGPIKQLQQAAVYGRKQPDMCCCAQICAGRVDLYTGSILEWE
eukprot:GHVS01052994.1.p1 GENE.GHVS01052994.1~~GHVS01052994.1.p1  ORF type:complete len:189 (+),score=49.00 GHVS01052994.1:182-748(+)